MKKLICLAICLIVSLGMAWTSPSLVNSFENKNGVWEFTPLTLAPTHVFVGLCWSALIIAVIFGSAWIMKDTTGKIRTFIASSTFGAVGLAFGMWFIVYWIDPTHTAPRSMANCLRYFRAEYQPMMMAASLISIFAVSIGVTVGRGVLNAGANIDPDASGSYQASATDRSANSGLQRIFRWRPLRRISATV